jgi:hypothetical protein
MRFPARRPGALIVVAAVALAVGGCAGEEPQPSAEAALCESLATFAGGLNAFSNLDPTTDSAEEIFATRQFVAESWEVVKIEAEDVTEADDAAVEAAWQDLSDAIDEIPTDQPVDDALATIQDEIDAVRGAYQEMADGVGCEPLPSAS